MGHCRKRCVLHSLSPKPCPPPKLHHQYQRINRDESSVIDLFSSDDHLRFTPFDLAPKHPNVENLLVLDFVLFGILRYGYPLFGFGHRFTRYLLGNYLVTIGYWGRNERGSYPQLQKTNPGAFSL